MIHSNDRRDGMSAAIFGLWQNWAVAVGLLAMLVLLSPYVSAKWMPPVCLTAYILLQIARNRQRAQRVPGCSRLYSEMSVILLAVACVSSLRYFWGGDVDDFELTGQPVNMQHPIIAILISAPVTAIVTAFFLLQRNEPLVCQMCHLRYGNVVENGFIGRLYRREWRYQSRLLMILSGVIAVVTWAYYLTYYVNVNLNNADFFFFIWMPVSLFVLSLVYLGWRYYSLWVFYCHQDSTHMIENPSSTTVRFLVLSGDKMLMDITATDRNFDNGQVVKRFDTPARIVLPYQDKVGQMQAQQLFQQISGISDAEIRPVYDSPDKVTYRNICHFFAFLDSPDEMVDSRLQGEWMTLPMIQELMTQHLTSADLNSELKRIYRVAMAWKTYDRSGRRLYRFKHYKPTFRLRDIRSWSVDYNDPLWLRVGHNNEDQRFFRIRRFFHKLQGMISGQGCRVNLFTY